MDPEKKFGMFLMGVFTAISASGLLILFSRLPSEKEAISTWSQNYSITESIRMTSETETVTSSVSKSISFPIDINFAGIEELMQLSGIGETLAKRILAYRAEGNYFYSIEDIQRVSGIGSALFEKIKPQICVNQDALPARIFIGSEVTDASIVTLAPFVIVTTTTPKATETTTPKPETTLAATRVIVFPLDINSATAEELTHLSGIGDTLSNRIVAYREATGGYYSTEELMNVKGIGESLYNRIKELVFADTSGLPPRVSQTTDELSVIEIPPLNINTATPAQLDLLPAITYQTALNIVAVREQNGGFTSIEELLYVDGISRDIYNSIKDYITL